jgi:hypothetical protein
MKKKLHRRRNNPFLESAVVYLWAARQSLMDFLSFHEEPNEIEPEEAQEPLSTSVGPQYPHLGCECWECDDARGTCYMLRNCETTISSQLIPIRGKLLALRASGFPLADSLADLILAARDAEEAQDDDEPLAS